MVSVIVAGLIGAGAGFGVGFPLGYGCGVKATTERLARASLILQGLAPDGEAVRAYAREQYAPGGDRDQRAAAREKAGGLIKVVLLSEENITEYRCVIGTPPEPAVVAAPATAPEPKPA